MAQARLSMRKIRDVLRLKYEAHFGDRRIAAAIGSSLSRIGVAHRRRACSTPLFVISTAAGGRATSLSFAKSMRWARSCLSIMRARPSALPIATPARVDPHRFLSPCSAPPTSGLPLARADDGTPVARLRQARSHCHTRSRIWGRVWCRRFASRLV